MFAGLYIEVGIVHPGPRKHWDGKKSAIPILWDCWLTFFTIPVHPAVGTGFLALFLIIFLSRTAWEDGNRIVPSDCVGST